MASLRCLYDCAQVQISHHLSEMPVSAERAAAWAADSLAGHEACAQKACVAAKMLAGVVLQGAGCMRSGGLLNVISRPL